MVLTTEWSVCSPVAPERAFSLMCPEQLVTLIAFVGRDGTRHYVSWGYEYSGVWGNSWVSASPITWKEQIV